MSAGMFLDTNVLVYAYSQKDYRTEAARRLLLDGGVVGVHFFPGSTRAGSACTSGPRTARRIEETERYFTQAENIIRSVVPPAELETIIDNIRTAERGHEPGVERHGDGRHGRRRDPRGAERQKDGSTWAYVREIRARLNREMPSCTFFTQPADIVGQILDFGLPAPIDLQVSGQDSKGNYAIVREMAARMSFSSAIVWSPNSCPHSTGTRATGDAPLPPSPSTPPAPAAQTRQGTRP